MAGTACSCQKVPRACHQMTSAFLLPGFSFSLGSMISVLICLLLALECRSNFETVLNKKGEVELELAGFFFFTLCKKACGIWHLNSALPDVLTNTVTFLLQCFESFKHDIDN